MMPADSSDELLRFERAREGLRAGPRDSSAPGRAAATQGFTNPGTPFALSAEHRAHQGQNQGMQMDDFVQDTAAMERDLRRRSRLLPVGIALILLAAFGAVVWFAFADRSSAPDAEQTVELIEAVPEPIKSKPEDPGGMEVQHQDKLILNPDQEKPQVERLLPPPETPLPVTTPDSGAADSDAADTMAEEERETTASDTLTSEATTLLEETEKTVEKAVQEAGKTSEAVSETVENAINSASQRAEKTVESLAGSSTSTAANGASDTKVPAKATPPSEQPQATAAQVAKVPADSGYVLQLASVHSEAIALQEWERIKGGNKNLLGQLKVIVEKAEIEGIGTRYRLQTGPFPTKATAQDLCVQLKAAKQDCLVKRR